MAQCRLDNILENPPGVGRTVPRQTRVMNKITHKQMNLM